VSEGGPIVFFALVLSLGDAAALREGWVTREEQPPPLMASPHPVVPNQCLCYRHGSAFPFGEQLPNEPAPCLWPSKHIN
jgi:hypothetical protein